MKGVEFMKYSKILIVTCLFLVFSIQIYAQITPEELIAQYIDNSYQSNIVGTMEMTVSKVDKEDRVSVFKTWSRGADLALVRYISPVREQGTAFLKMKDEMYFYLPRVERVMRISGRQQVLNSDFTGSDILGIDLTEYNSTFEGVETIDGQNNYVYLLISNNRSTTYSMLRVWITPSNQLATKQAYYTSSGRLLNVLTFEEYGEIDGRLSPTRMVMESKIQEGNYTTLRILEGTFTVEIPDYIFTLPYLEQGF